MSTEVAEKKNWADRMTEWMEKLAPLFDQPHLASVRDGLAALMPLLIIGAFSLLAVQFPIQGWLDYLDSNPALTGKIYAPFNICFGLLSLFASVTIAYGLSRRRGLEPLMPSMMALLAFVTITSPILGMWGEEGLPGTYFDNSGLFTAIIVSLLVVEIYNFFVQRNLIITMPEGVPPAIANSFVALIPGTAILFLA